MKHKTEYEFSKTVVFVAIKRENEETVPRSSVARESDPKI